MRDKIIEELLNNQDIKYLEFNQKICKTKYKMIGVRVPIIKKIAKKYTKQYGIKLFDELQNEYFEEILIKGLILGYNDTLDEKYIKKFVPLIDNWAICDMTISNMKKIKNNLEKYYLFINKTYRNSQAEYSLRFLLVTYLNYYIKDEYIDDIINYIDTIKSDYYYVKMANAWLISIMYIKEKNKIKNYLLNNNLDKFTHNKAIQKIRESLCISKEEKQELNKLKRS